MRKHNRMLCLLLSALLVGCGGGASDAGDTETVIASTDNPTSEPVQESEEETEAEEEILFYEKDGRQYQNVPDLVSGKYLWASVVTEGTVGHDEHGCPNIDYNSQLRSFESRDGHRVLPVRRWDNLLYSAGEYLIFEYDGTIYISKSSDLYKPVLSYDVSGTHGIIDKVPKGYVTADERLYRITFYDNRFGLVKTVDGYRGGESGTLYNDGLMAVRDMNTGLMGYMDQDGNMAIPCSYGRVSDFSNGYASVLVGARMDSYTEDGGTVAMFKGEGGQWGIIDVRGNYVLEPSERFASRSDSDSLADYDWVRGFSPIREDGTADFIAYDEDGRVIETVRVR